MSWRRSLDLLRGEEVDMVLKPHFLSFAKYHVFFLYLILISLLLRRVHLLLEDNVSFLSAFSFLDAVLSNLSMNVVDAIFLFSFWVILLTSGWAGSRLLHSRRIMFYVISVAASSTLLEFYWFMTHFETAFIQISHIKLLLLAGTSVGSMVLIDIYRRKCLYIITNRRIIIKEGLKFKEEEVTYDEISHIRVKQGVLGRVFNFGTIILVSTFDFGLNESLYKDIPEMMKESEVKITERTLRNGVPENWRSKRQWMLFGVPNPRRVRVIIGNRQMEAKESSF